MRDYFKKQDEINKRKEDKENVIKKQNDEKNLIIQIKHKHLIGTKDRYEINNEKFKHDLEAKLKKIDFRVSRLVFMYYYYRSELKKVRTQRKFKKNSKCYQ